ncbi:hypothetical protein DID78_01715 [Candidatus Marinamargulisbacteria bacterium SCGC AG-343-D04]|nr:hypothetical protein DID78_01715 [Candidatus Marinamargulisbacteria bacterium SCGC AG-343-D04]
MTSQRWAVFQTNTTENIDENKRHIERLLESDDAIQSEVWVFPECSGYRYMGKGLLKFFKRTDNIVPWFQELAKCHQKWLIMGSFFEKVEGQRKAYNTCVVINPEGDIVETYRKIHLFDVDVESISMRESSAFLPGDSPKIVQIGPFKIGLSICFDCRFPELYRVYADEGCDVVVIPSSFTTPTGMLHWHTLCRARAIENQCYVVAPNQSGIGANQVPTYGHSMIVDPSGSIVQEAPQEGESVLSYVLKKECIQAIRHTFPVLECRRIGKGRSI